MVIKVTIRDMRTDEILLEESVNIPDTDPYSNVLNTIGTVYGNLVYDDEWLTRYGGKK